MLGVLIVLRSISCLFSRVVVRMHVVWMAMSTVQSSKTQDTATVTRPSEFELTHIIELPQVTPLISPCADNIAVVLWTCDDYVYLYLDYI